MDTIAHIYNDFDSKFGVPRQSGLAPSALSQIVFTPQYRNPEALRGLQGFSHIWLLWELKPLPLQHPFNSPPRGQKPQKGGVTARTSARMTVRPPRLGGNQRMGVWATRSPFRPNNIGLSCVKIEKIELNTKDGPVIEVSGADMMSGTEILDIKPYLPFTDSHPEATSGWTAEVTTPDLEVEIPKETLASYPFTERQWQALMEILKGDPRPHYQDDDERIYSFEYAHHTVHFKVKDGTAFVMPS